MEDNTTIRHFQEKLDVKNYNNLGNIYCIVINAIFTPYPSPFKITTKSLEFQQVSEVGRFKIKTVLIFSEYTRTFSSIVKLLKATRELRHNERIVYWRTNLVPRVVLLRKTREPTNEIIPCTCMMISCVLPAIKPLRKSNPRHYARRLQIFYVWRHQ